jgi:hypothetical protein
MGGHEPDQRDEEPIPPPAASGPVGFSARVPARQPGALLPGHLQGDLGPGVGGADDQDAALPQLGWIPILAGVQLEDARVELGGEGGDPGPLVGARCHHDMVGLKSVLPRRHDRPIPLPGQPIDAHAGSNREVEPGRIRLQVVGDLVLGGERPGRRGEGPAWQPVVARGGEQAQRVPPFAPGVADALVGVQDHEPPTSPGQVLADRQARLPAPDDHRLELLCAAGAIHPLSSLHLARTLGGRRVAAHRRNQPNRLGGRGQN